MIPSSTLLDVSDFFVPHRILTSPVSIHAPTWGATGRVVYRGNNNAFQSTLPHGERRPRSFSPTARRCFNPRSRMGSDRAKIAVSWPSKCFNPRSHTGSDTHVRKAHQGKLVSIHAPTWGATRIHKPGISVWGVSIHAPTWGATASGRVVPVLQGVSIHAPTWGATSADTRTPFPYLFQPTLPHGERLSPSIYLIFN